ncbi:RNA binding protein EIF1AD [Fasciola hepatica]|uniref:Probable RNA-binding protein EIF1AD n=1 Tax=Fasciola hepatica TaxID=6192 RepID=A0A4E0RBM3_FASHE|nr:RNA binding protein EIF1AD [Fasciola hepatica]
MYPSSVPRRKKVEQELFESLPSIESGEFICKLRKSQGNYLFTAFNETNVEILVSIPERFRNAYYFAPGDFVLCKPVESKRVKAEIRALLQGKQIEHLTVLGLWPGAFSSDRYTKQRAEKESYMPNDMLPPSDDSSEGSEEESVQESHLS